MRTKQTLWLTLALSLTLSGMTHAADTITPTAKDPNLWLENIDGPKQLDWVKQQNAETVKTYADNAEFKQLDARLLEVLDSNARIPMVSKIGDHFYNFWRDKEHPKGLWRRTTLDEYRKDKPNWETVIDLDALAAVGEGKLGLARRRLPQAGLSPLPGVVVARRCRCRA